MSASSIHTVLHQVTVSIVVVMGLCCLCPSAAHAERLGVQRFRFTAGSRYLVVEILDDDLAHFELSENSSGPNPMNGIYVTPMIDKAAYNQYLGPNADGFSANGNVIETNEVKISVSAADLCVTVFDKARNVTLTKICGDDLDKDEKKLLIKKGEMQNAYGIGNLFHDPSNADGDWVGRSWEGRNHGNFRYGFWVRGSSEGSDSFHGGGPSVSQFPMLYALGRSVNSDSFQNYGLLVDQIYRMSWDFRGQTWVAKSWGDQLRWFVFTGPDVKDLRKDFLELVGRPPVPPRETFGLWVSEFGYDNWTEVRQDLDSLRSNGFPVDGVALDLQWFGGSFDLNEHDAVSEPNRMGTLRFDSNNFPNPQANIAQFYNDFGVRFMPIEESYIDNRLPEHTELWNRKFLARVTDTEPVTVMRDFRHEGNSDHGVWWGRGGMLDWSNPNAGDYWHQQKRLDLGKMGITSHWLDLGEPEMYYQHAIYHGFPELNKHRHGDIHNVYNLRWAESIFRNYRDPQNAQLLQTTLGLHAAPRHFTLSRSGTVGSQRYGGMWSGDVGRNMGTLRAHLNTQMHMSMAGVDYYTSDAGGFLEGGETEAGYSQNALYTQWFANNCLLDIPVRPHGWANNEQASGNLRFGPDQRGHRESNLANIRLRYKLTPYIYSLAHDAWNNGDAIFPPLVYHFQGDIHARKIGNVKMIGRDLLFGVVAGYNQTDRRVYLPKGQWIDFHSLDWYNSNGEETPDLPIFRARDEHRGLFTIPLFARAGAIIPLMHVDAHTRNISEKRSFVANTDAERQREKVQTTQFWVRVFASPAESSFTCIEDDGRTLEYLNGHTRHTRITQQSQGQVARVKIHATQGDHTNALQDRSRVVELVTDSRAGQLVTVSGELLPQLSSQADFDAGQTGWLNAGRNRILARSASKPVGTEQEFVFQLTNQLPPRTSLHFVCTNGNTTTGEAIFVLGNLPELGAWDPARAVRLDATQYPIWSRVIDNLPSGTNVEWKFIRRREDSASPFEWDSAGPNHRIHTPSAGFGGTARAGFTSN